MCALNVCPIRPLRRQGGAALVEFAIVSLPLLLCGLALPELARWQLARQVAYLALVEAGRAGATGHAQPAAVQAAFEEALLPLYAGPRAAERMRTAFERVQRLTGLPPWQIEVLQPGREVFADFADPALPIAQTLGRPALRHDFQVEQHARYSTRWPSGVGPLSGKTVFEANLLHLRLVYLHEPMLPWLRALLKRLGNAAGSYGQRAMARGGMLPVTLELEMDMQSHAVDWSSPSPPPQARVIFGSHAAGFPLLTSGNAASGFSIATPPPKAASSQASAREEWVPKHLPKGNIDAPQPDPACGVALCCAP